MPFDCFRANFGDASASGSTFSAEQENIIINQRLRENVMPLELAIKRELDYRMKVESLQGKVNIEASLLSQGPPPVPGPSIVGRKRKTMSSNLRSFSTQQPRSSNGSSPLLCTLCQLAFSSKSGLRQHRLDSKHKAKLAESHKKSKQGKNKPQWCKLCRISCSDERAFTQHLAGKKHAASVHAIEAAKSIKEDVEKEVFKVKWDELEWDTVA